ncbi:tartrate-resistant acid phosphatase type 5-like isoform X1 [Scyliorhinus canicula]|uniref:tartrate-resistant acid phosphatase type 5-like isoform X1 n=2 Tax=Scyliorhinus canicula TaxID=7830 RepID=UPI0018F34D37|nr:tartrate-resistant acid phosphatase type 5-like isoform X1 [Scyliorhinus canicula]
MFLFQMAMFLSITVILLIILQAVASGPSPAHQMGLSKAIRFMALGDWGGLPFSPYTTPVEKSTAQQMGVVAETMGTDFVLSLGDNFYYNGIYSLTDKRFQETFEEIFSAESLKDVPWFVVAGNHDHLGNVTAQIEYSKVSKRWNFPYYYYDLNFTIADSNTTVTILMLDTVLLCGNSDDFQGKEPEAPKDYMVANTQLEWVRAKLKNSRSDFLIVAGHYPVWSIAEHGPTKCLVQKLYPLLTQYRVSAYFSGHDHNLQFIQDGDGIGYVVSGAGNFMEYSTKHKHLVPKEWLKFFYADIRSLGGFAYVEITPEQMMITYIEALGKSLYQTTIPRRSDG